jgi:hypothetical protein
MKIFRPFRHLENLRYAKDVRQTPGLPPLRGEVSWTTVQYRLLTESKLDRPKCGAASEASGRQCPELPPRVAPRRLLVSSRHDDDVETRHRASY